MLSSNSFSSNSFLKQPRQCTLHAIPVFGRCGGVRSCLFLLVLPSIQTVLSAPDFHRFGLSCGRASLAESLHPVRMRRFVRFFACLRERFAGCDRRFGISPTPEHDVDTDYATAHAGGLICFLWDNFRDKMTFYDCALGASSSPSQQALAAATCGTVLEPYSSIFGNDLSRFHNGGERQTDQRVMRASRGLLRAY